MPPSQTCDRCGGLSWALTGSYFDTAMICAACDDRERQSPRFEEARRREHEAVRAGDMNYPGTGLPPDLRR